MLRKPPKRRIGELLVEEGLINEEQLVEALRVQRAKGGKTVENLVALGHIDLQAFADFLSKQPGVASIDLSHYEIPEELSSLIPRDLALKHEVFPIDKLGKLLTVGMACPLDDKAVKELEDATGLRVKPLLCSMSDIRATLERYYPAEKPAEETVSAGTSASEAAEEKERQQIESSLKLESLASMVRHLDSLPALPDTVRQVKESMDDPMSSTKDVARIVGLDPTVSAKLLSLANSAAYGFPNRVDNIDMATTLLGLRETYSVVLACEVIDFFPKGNNFNHKAFWKDAIFCAAASKAVARLSKLKQSSGIFSAGLLHAIGRIALAQVAPERYAKIDPTLRGLDLVEAEESELGMGYPEAGYVLAEHWGLPADMMEVIRFHTRPQFASEAPELVKAVALAEGITSSRDREDPVTYLMEHRSGMAEAMGLSADVIRMTIKAVTSSVDAI